MPPATQRLGGTCAPPVRSVKHVPWGVRAKSASTGLMLRHGQVGTRRQVLSHQYRYFVGIDWATESHEACVLNAEQQVVDRKTVEQGEPTCPNCLTSVGVPRPAAVNHLDPLFTTTPCDIKEPQQETFIFRFDANRLPALIARHKRAL